MVHRRRPPDFGRWSQWCFDCDGTILDSSASFTAAYEQAVSLLGGKPVHDYWFRRRAGVSEAMLCTMAGLHDAEFEHYRRLRQEAFDASSVAVSPFPAAVPLLQRLRSLGIRVVVVSHRSTRDSLVRDLQRAGLSRYTSQCHATKGRSERAGGRWGDAYAGKSKVLRRLAAHISTVMVGDSHADIAAAQSARIASIGVATGECSTSRLLRCGATWVFPSLTELHRLVV